MSTQLEVFNSGVQMHSTGSPMMQQLLQSSKDPKTQKVIPSYSWSQKQSFALAS